MQPSILAHVVRKNLLKKLRRLNSSIEAPDSIPSAEKPSMNRSRACGLLASAGSQSSHGTLKDKLAPGFDQSVKRTSPNSSPFRGNTASILCSWICSSTVQLFRTSNTRKQVNPVNVAFRNRCNEWIRTKSFAHTRRAHLQRVPANPR